ncbi:isocitrate lyase/phosphoenolpyruvate mutase family protein [Kribbella deserti]|uniref:Isocitrate lyase/phosphoenolpyruvate mutase family protein n=1 Tax=Kribbella deserti TaxID=1926257 RepID=A0ABV6QUV4_9ACTN
MTDNATALQDLHREGPLVLPNAWDAGSAAAIEAAGAKAIATTSARISWAQGLRPSEPLLGKPEQAERLRTARETAKAVGVDLIKVLVTGPLPLNVMVHPGALGVSELIDLGVARISLGSGIAQASYGLAAAAAREVLGAGTYRQLEDGMDYSELNALLT